MIKLDVLTMHTDDLGDTVGHFYGVPIREFFAEDARLRDEEENARITRASMKARANVNVHSS